jgi:hypothetical protein
MMFGEPKDEPDACNARLFIADNYGDNSSTMRCQLAPGHDGPHKEQFERESDNGNNVVVITWTKDERARCDHGCGQWNHDHELYNNDGETPRCSKYAAEHEYSDCAYCHPEDPPLTCGHCGKTHYYEEGHLRHCAEKPFTCAICGESGIGNHDWPSGCPKERESLARGTADEFAEELSR